MTAILVGIVKLMATIIILYVMFEVFLSIIAGIAVEFWWFNKKRKEKRGRENDDKGHKTIQ